MQLIQDLLYLLALAVPAWLAARLLVPRQTRLQAVSDSLLLTVTLVSIPVFVACLLSRSYLSTGGILVASGLVTLIALFMHWRLRGDHSVYQRLFSFEQGCRWENGILAGALVVFAIFLVNYDRDHFQYGCINGVVMQSITVEAARPYDPHGGREPGTEEDNAPEHEDWGKPGVRDMSETMGLIDVHGTGQRLGTTAVIAPFVRLFGSFGFRLIYSLLPVLAFLYGIRLLLAIGVEVRLAIAASTLALINPYILKILILDENVMAFCFATAALAILVERGHAALAGIAFGAALGIRHIDLFFVPAALILIGRNYRASAAFLAAAVVAALPCMLHHYATYGNILAHEHFVDEVFQWFPHSLWGWEFNYSGLLNYPFHDTWIRTPYNPFPTLLYYPVNLVAHLGSVLIAVTLIGSTVLQKHRPLAWAMLAWIIPQFLLLGTLENWMDPNKMGVIIILFPLLILLLGLGLQWLFEGKLKRYLRISILVLLSLSLSAASWGAGLIATQDDPRFYIKYPNVRAERAEYLQSEVSSVTQGNLLPSMDLLQQYSSFEPSGRLTSLAADFLDRAFRRPAEVVEESNAPERLVSFDLSTPLIGRQDFARFEKGAPVIDTRAKNPPTQLNGLTAWDGLAARIRVARDSKHSVNLYLSFGKDGLADIYSQTHYSMEEKERPDLATQTTSGSEFTLLLQVGDHLTVFETVSMDEVLIYAWDIKVGADQLEIGRPRKMFHN